jgi:DNA processing protein
MQTYDIKSISSTSSVYPKRLSSLKDPPKHIHSRGNSNLLASGHPIVAIVGSRRGTAYGTEVTNKIVKQLVRHNIIIMSGLAIGIDTCAHKAALEHGGATIAVVPSDVTHIYPRQNRHIAEQIVASNGLLISEHEHKPTLLPFEFIKRNRLIAALCDMLIVIEATHKSGTLGTARTAKSLGKHVGVIPGNITSTLSNGANQLLHEGAQPILSYKDVLSLLKITEQAQLALPNIHVNSLEASLLDLIEEDRYLMSDLSTRTKKPIHQVAIELSKLEVMGLVHCGSDSRWHRTI